MASVNKVILIGNLGKDPELKTIPSGTLVATFSLATTEQFTDKNGQKKDQTEWHNIVVWGKLAELAGKYLAKGRSVYVEGSLKTRSWDDKDGKKRFTTEIIANQLQFLGSKPEGNSGRDEAPPPYAEQPADDLPF